MKLTILGFMLFSGLSAIASEELKPVIACNGTMGTGEAISLRVSQRIKNGNPVLGFSRQPLFSTIIKQDEKIVYESKTTLLSKENGSFYSTTYFHLEPYGNKWSLYLENRNEFGNLLKPYLNSLDVICNRF